MSMCHMVVCLVDREGKVYAKDGVHSFSQLAEIFKIDKDRCLKYEFWLITRKLVQDLLFMDVVPFPVKQSHNRTAQRFFDRCVGTPEKLMAYVLKGNWNENILWNLLTDSAGAEYKKATAAADAKYYYKVYAPMKAKYDKTFTATWVKHNEPRAITTKAEYKEICATMETEFDKACATGKAEHDKVCSKIWLKIFVNPKNRIEIWKN